MSKNAKIKIWTQNWTLEKKFVQRLDFWNSVGQVMSKSRLSLFHLLWTRCHLVLSPLVRNTALCSQKTEKTLLLQGILNIIMLYPQFISKVKDMQGPTKQSCSFHLLRHPKARFVKFVMYQRLWSWMSKVSRASCWNHNEHHPDHFFISQRAGKNVVHEKLCVTKSYQSLVLW